MDVLEGRNLATWAMLNEWEDLLTVKSDTTMAAWDFVMRVGDLAYCMTNSKVEEYGLTRPNVPSRYNFKQVSDQLPCCTKFLVFLVKHPSPVEAIRSDSSSIQRFL